MDYRTLTVKEAAALLGWTPGRLRMAIRRRAGPKAYKVSERSIIIKLSDFREWIDRLERVHAGRDSLRMGLGEKL